MALTDKVFQLVQSIPDKRTSLAVNKIIDRIWPKTRGVNITAALTLNEVTHEGKMLTVNSAAGIAIVLPASTGQGAKYRFFIGTTITSVGTTIKVANASDTMVGFALLAQDAGDTSVLFGASGTDDTITLNGTTTGGTKGDYIELEDVTLNLWRVNLIATATGTEATPFSATVA